MAGIDQEQVWSARYDAAGEEYLFGTAPNAFLQRQAERLKPGLSALSVADGEGRNSVWLAEEGLAVTAVEISPVALHKARRLAVSRHVTVDFIQADLLRWDWPVAAFDVVAAIFIQFVGPAERDALFARLKDALKPGGLLLLQGYTPKQLEYGTGGPSAVENLYTEELLRHAFGDFELLELRSHEALLEEGSAHRGMSAVIDLVARKPG
ncbi:SAM-dependent methyltransferase [Denitratisoma sp. DHT3]|uniref:SAM-dependent methyltransferase n=1 Tax=Denitratisoma sp. DHT3 TaxID=1981880 RepID=UPI001198690E|nr:class I SAM-dependent methyltransferase [Denitratisoma sp. DHT3]QDX80317.1 SAM-dependent methyltransferase [Denitratisoma sp. DHT3]